MKMKKLVVVILCLGVLVMAAGAKDPPASRPANSAALRVLFIGNSYTYGNRLPEVVAGMAAADRTVRPMKVRMVASGGKDLVWHSRNKATLDAIAAGGWDYVVLQDQSLTPTLIPQRTQAGGRALDKAIRKTGARTMLFMTWQRRPTPEMLKKYPKMHERNSKTYMDLARELKAAVAPVGYAWKAAYDANPNWPLYAKDNSHPARMGTYLTACVFFSAIYNKPPTSLPAKITVAKSGKRRTVLGIPPADAKKLQTIAWQAARRAKRELAGEGKTTPRPTTRPAAPWRTTSLIQLRSPAGGDLVSNNRSG